MGTKLDVVNANSKLRQVEVREAKSFASSHHIVDTIETSSKDDTNIEKTFVKLAKALQRKYSGYPSQSGTGESVVLNTQSLQENGQGWKCSC